jgi:hypothetical protein
MADPAIILQWLKEAGAYAYRLEDPDRPGGRLLVGVLVGGSTVGVRVLRPGANWQHYQCLTWSEIERAETNPLLKLIEETIAGKTR